MGKRKLTPGEERAWEDLARAAKRLRQAETRAKRARKARKRPEGRQEVSRAD